MVRVYREARSALLDYLGFRGFILVAFGLMYIPVGVGVFYPSPSAVDDALVHTHLPLWFRLVIWIGLGSTAIAAGALKQIPQAVGFFCLFCPPFERFLSYLWATLIDGPQWLVGTVLYGMLALTVRVLAAWDEPVRTR